MKIFKSTAKFIRKRVGFRVTLTTRRLRKPSQPVLTRFRAVKRSLTKEFRPEHLSPITEEPVTPKRPTAGEDTESGQRHPVAMETGGACSSPQSPGVRPLSPYCHPRFRPSKSLPTLTPKRRLPNPHRLRREVVSCRSLARRQQISETMTRGRLIDNIQESIREQREDVTTCSAME
ncbi:hypothetical protein CAPTEDRAFT_207657 [Capitella teleta]|uniref:Uncharacterized protein n=1 Tax=Capitella teleta TaxID=283909 RepID=R7UTM9_CAPTE|nr:hypothetical protein CAPTEDRAFT_207657 [Capitella teleta]|eukprot:ELU09874.1 hypothetical protein CAPTEDRAFT_207657 [Capitella teleta]